MAIRTPLRAILATVLSSCLWLSACSDANRPGAGPSSDSKSVSTGGGALSTETIKPLGDMPKPMGPFQTADAAKTAADAAPPEEIKPIPTPMETFRELDPPTGLKVNALFTEPLKDTDARVARLENAVQSLRNDFDTVVPAMVRIVSMENSMRDLIDQMKTITDAAHPAAGQAAANAAAPTAPGTEAAAKPAANNAGKPSTDIAPAAITPPSAATPAPEKSAATAAPMPSAQSSPSSAPAESSTAPATATGDIKDLRVGDHGTTTRIVLDMTAKTTATTRFQQDGRKLVIDLPNLVWNGRTSGAEKASALVSGYQYDNGKLIISLQNAATIKSQQLLPPGDGSPDYRLVIDLAGAGG